MRGCQHPVCYERLRDMPDSPLTQKSQNTQEWQSKQPSHCLVPRHTQKHEKSMEYAKRNNPTANSEEVNFFIQLLSE